jgi:catechol 2,3-dioxygenase-like lactoylglutathione lyase family enzyme
VLDAARVVAFVGSSDLDRSRAFYEGVLGLTIVEASPFALVARTSASPTTIRITATSSASPAGYTVLGWTIDDIAATVADLTKRGVAFTRFDGMEQDAAGVWTSPSGDKVAWFSDPDGNTLSLTESR